MLVFGETTTIDQWKLSKVSRKSSTYTFEIQELYSDCNDNGWCDEGRAYCFLATKDDGFYTVGCACKSGYIGPTKTVDELVEEQKKDPSYTQQCTRSF